MTTFWYSNLGKNSPLFFVVFSLFIRRAWNEGGEKRWEKEHKTFTKIKTQNSIYLHWLFTGFRCTFTALFTFWEIVFLCLQLFFICSFSRLFDFLYPIFSYFFFGPLSNISFSNAKRTHTHTHEDARGTHKCTHKHTHINRCVYPPALFCILQFFRCTANFWPKLYVFLVLATLAKKNKAQMRIRFPCCLHALCCFPDCFARSPNWKWVQVRARASAQCGLWSLLSGILGVNSVRSHCSSKQLFEKGKNKFEYIYF